MENLVDKKILLFTSIILVISWGIVVIGHLYTRVYSDISFELLQYEYKKMLFVSSAFIFSGFIFFIHLYRIKK